MLLICLLTINELFAFYPENKCYIKNVNNVALLSATLSLIVAISLNTFCLFLLAYCMEIRSSIWHLKVAEIIFCCYGFLLIFVESYVYLYTGHGFLHVC